MTLPCFTCWGSSGTPQKKILCAVAIDGKVESITSGKFASHHHLTSVSSVNSAVKGLLDRNVLTCERGIYSVYDKLFELWLKRQSAELTPGQGLPIGR